MPIIMKRRQTIFHSGFFLLSVSLLFTSGCFRANTSWDHARWSDDGQHVSRVQHVFESKSGFNTDTERNFETEIWRGPASDLETSEPIGETLSGKSVTLFDMGSAGYLISGRILLPEDSSDDEDEGTLFQFHHITLEGTATLLGQAQSGHNILAGDDVSLPLTFIPGPDGSQILQVEATGATSIALTILDAATLEENATRQELVLENPNRQNDPSVYIAWTIDDAVIIADAHKSENPRHWRMAVGSAPTSAENLASECFDPPTSSSDFNADGLHIQCDDEGSVFTETDAGFKQFGCEH